VKVVTNKGKLYNEMTEDIKKERLKRNSLV